MHENNNGSSLQNYTILCEASNNLDAVMTILNININQFPSGAKELLKIFEDHQHESKGLLDAEQINHMARHDFISNRRTQCQLQQTIRKQEVQLNALQEQSVKLQKFLHTINEQVNADSAGCDNLLMTLENSKQSCMELQKNSNTIDDLDVEELMNKYDLLLKIKNARRKTINHK